MAISTEPLLSQVVVDVQFTRGIVYLDRCGSLMLKLEDALGRPFQGNVPMMDQAELRSVAERLVFSYGPKNFNGTQLWVENPARLEQLAPIAWEVVSEALDVQRHVQRVGVRFIQQWKVDELDEAREAMAACRLVLPSEELGAVIGEAKKLTWSLLVEDSRGRLRVATDVTELNLEGSLPEDLAAKIPKCALVLDLDHTHPGVPPYNLTREGLKEFIRTSWQRTKAAATMFRTHIGTRLAQRIPTDAPPTHGPQGGSPPR